MSLAERAYRILLALYPASFRRQYQALMEQAFRDQLRNARVTHRLYIHTGIDILRSAASLQMEENVQTMAAVLFALAAALFLGRFELHTDDTGVEVAFILLFTFILGCWQPKRAWLTPLLGLSIPIAQLIGGHPAPIMTLALITTVVLIVGAAGSLAGAWARRLWPART